MKGTRSRAAILLLVPAVLSAVLLTAASQTPLEKALGGALPGWGTTSEQLQRALPALQVHEPHWCGNGESNGNLRELREPNLEVGGEQVRLIDYRLGAEGLEAVTFDFGPGAWRETTTALMAHFERSLGPPTKRRGDVFAIWELPTATVVVPGPAIEVMDPGSPHARETGALLEDLERRLDKDCPHTTTLPCEWL